MLNLSISHEAAKELLAATEFVSWENKDFKEGVNALEQVLEAKPATAPTKQATVHQVALVTIMAWGSDVGLFVNGGYVMSADPDQSDDATALKATAFSLAAQLEIPVSEIEFTPEDEWQWGEVHLELIGEGKLMNPDTPH